MVTGSESTGKTELAGRLAQHYGAELVPEFVRGFAESMRRPISFADHGPIARGQMELEDRHAGIAAREGRFVIQDTDLLSTVVYCEHYFGECPKWIAEAARERRPDLYLLADTDVEWVADGIRDRGHMREKMQQLFLGAVIASAAPCAIVAGSREARWRLATCSVEAILAGKSGAL